MTTGHAATFSVAADGSGALLYQWQRNGTAIAGATSSSYTTPPTTMANNGSQFVVIISDTAGSVTSNPATLTVTTADVAPSVISQPISQTITAGQTATFSVIASGTAPVSYQWSKNGGAISGATSSTYTTPPETTSDNGAQFTVTVSNVAGRATSTAATLTVNAATFLLSATPTSLNFGRVNTGASSTLAVTLTNSGDSEVTISNVSVSGAGFNASGVSAGQILTPGQRGTLNATFSPAAAGSVTGSLVVVSNASDSPATIVLSGTGLQVVSHLVDLSWTASTSVVAGYNVYRGGQSGGPYTKLNSTPVALASDTDSTAQSGQTYFYVVTAVDSNNVESAYSNEVSAVIPIP